MKVWNEVKLGDICAIKGGKRLPAGHVLVDYRTAHPYIKSRDIRHGKVSSAELQFLEPSTFEKIKRYTVRQGDVCITIVANIGDVGLVPKELDGASLTENAVKLTDVRRDVDPRFLALQLAHRQFKGFMELLAAGAAQSKLGIYKIKIIKVRLPSRATQAKIAAILTAYDELIESNKRRIGLLEKMAEEIYREWFIRLRFPGHEKMKSVKGLPVGWQQRKISDFARCKYGYTESAVLNDELPKFLRVMDINKASFISWSEVPNCPISDLEFQKLKLAQNDVVIARMADPGKVAIVEQNVNAVFASYLIKIAYDRALITPYYLFYTLRTDAYSGYFSGANSGATRGSINGTLIGNTKIIVPQRELQDQFEAVIRQIRAQLSNHVREIEMLSQIRDRLLPRLISGKLPVDNFDIQFPLGMAEELNAQPTATSVKAKN